MASKDQAIGGIIFLVCLVIGILYTVGLFYYGGPLGGHNWELALLLVVIPVFLAFIVIMAIGAWIGWTMATTPPPKPIEEITSEIEERKEEEKPAEAVPETAEEEKKAERKRKS